MGAASINPVSAKARIRVSLPCLLEGTTMSSLRYRPEVDGLRALAILSVLIYHFFPTLMQGGLVGVDIFFVISGYLITKTLITNNSINLQSIREFYVRRILRIFPALILMFWFVYSFGWIALYADEFKELGLHIASGAAFVSNITYLNESGYFDQNSELKPLLHLWSLGVEEQFYLVWPLVLAFILRMRQPLYAIWAIFILSFSACIAISYHDANSAYYLPITRFWEILLGAVIAANEESDGNQKLGDRKSLFGLLLIGASFIFVNGKENFPGWQALIPVAGAYLIIRNSSGGYTNRILASKVLVGIGLISYPLYIWHWPALAFLKITELNPGINLKIAAISLAFVLAVVTYRYAEIPIRRMQGKNKMAFILLFLMIFTGLVGINTYNRAGMDFREVNYAVYKSKILQTVSAYLGLQSEPKLAPTSPFLNQAKFEALEPGYTDKLVKLINTLKSSGNLNAIKNDFDLINKEGFKCDDAKCKNGTTGQTIVIVGDSHAENFYSAIASTHKNYNVVRFTDAGCTPIASRYRDVDNRCKVLLGRALSYLQSNKVELLILAARWPQNYAEVVGDIESYKQYVKNIAIAGPSVIFFNEVSQILLRYDGSMDVNQHINTYMDFERFELNEQMHRFAQLNNIAYIDRIAPLCGDGSCRLTQTGEELFIFDNGHLSNTGAKYLGERLLKDRVIASLTTSR